MIDEEKKFIESVRGLKRISKLTAKRLATIWNSQHPEDQILSCFCSSMERTRFYASFFSWLDESYPNDDTTAE